MLESGRVRYHSERAPITLRAAKRGSSTTISQIRETLKPMFPKELIDPEYIEYYIEGKNVLLKINHIPLWVHNVFIENDRYIKLHCTNGVIELTPEEIYSISYVRTVSI